MLTSTFTLSLFDFSSIFPRRRRRYLASSQVLSTIAELGKIFLNSSHSDDDRRSHHIQLSAEVHTSQLDRSSGTCGIGGRGGGVIKGFPVIRRLRTPLFDPWEGVFVIYEIPACIEHSGKKVYSVAAALC